MDHNCSTVLLPCCSSILEDWLLISGHLKVFRGCVCYCWPAETMLCQVTACVVDTLAVGACLYTCNALTSLFLVMSLTWTTSHALVWTEKVNCVVQPHNEKKLSHALSCWEVSHWQLLGCNVLMCLLHKTNIPQMHLPIKFCLHEYAGKHCTIFSIHALSG